MSVLRFCLISYPQSLKIQGVFTILCIIGSINFEEVLCDLGASINLMPFSILHKLGLKEHTPFNMILQLVDRSIAYPRGILEDVLVKVDKFIFPVDFVVLDNGHRRGPYDTSNLR